MYSTNSSSLDDECTAVVGVCGHTSCNCSDCKPLTVFVDYDWMEYVSETQSIENIYQFKKELKTRTIKQIKSKWLEVENEKAYLFVTKKGSVWIPKAMISNIKKTKKGKYIIDVYSSFKLTYMDAYFNCFKYTRKNYERT